MSREDFDNTDSTEVPLLTNFLKLEGKPGMKNERINKLIRCARWLDKKYHLGGLASTRDNPKKDDELALEGVDLDARRIFTHWILDRKQENEILHRKHMRDSMGTGHVILVSSSMNHRAFNAICENAAAFEESTGELLPMDMLTTVAEIDFDAKSIFEGMVSELELEEGLL